MKTELPADGNPDATEVRVLIAYDSVGSGKRAKELCDRLQVRLGPEYQLHFRLWSLAALQRTCLAHAALADATSAALILIAVDGGQPLPPPIRSWFVRCACRIRGSNGPLVMQLHGITKMEEELASAYCFLKQIAQDAGVKFFSEVVKPQDDELQVSIESIHQRARMNSPMLDALLHLH